MADLMNKYFLDYEGLSAYDELIKKYIDKHSATNETVVNLISSLASLAEAHEALDEKVTLLDGDVGTEGSIKNSVQKAVNDLVNNAPEALDTLKEIADWIAEDETGTVELINRVSTNEEAIEALQNKDKELKEYIDEQDNKFFNLINSIDKLKIAGLFSVEQDADTSAAVAIAQLDDGAAIVLTENQVITDNIAISKSCYINANGSTFEGTVTVPAGVDVVIENATFTKPVVVA